MKKMHELAARPAQLIVAGAAAAALADGLGLAPTANADPNLGCGPPTGDFWSEIGFSAGDCVEIR
jgi:hypothetical protein